MHPETLTADQILTALAAETDDPDLILEHCQSFFQRTWLASHIRLLTMSTEDQPNTALMLGLALRDNQAAELGLNDWLPQMTVRQASLEDLTGALLQALSDMDEAPERRNPLMAHVLQHWLEQIGKRPPVSVWSLEPLEPGPKPASAYEYGVTQYLSWWHGQTFGFLELHNES
jgi:hypothetical protein